MMLLPHHRHHHHGDDDVMVSTEIVADLNGTVNVHRLDNSNPAVREVNVNKESFHSKSLLLLPAKPVGGLPVERLVLQNCISNVWIPPMTLAMLSHVQPQMC